MPTLPDVPSIEGSAGVGNGEPRLFPRFPFHRWAVLTLGSEQIDGTLIDLSVSGALFNSEIPLRLPLGACCRFDILHGSGRRIVRAHARIVYAQPDLIGMRFCHLDPGAVQELMQIAEMNLGPPALMKRGLGALLRLPAGRADHDRLLPRSERRKTVGKAHPTRC